MQNHAFPRKPSLLGAILLAAVHAAGETRAAIGAETMKSKPFTGAKANTGTATFAREDGRCTLTLSDDFKVPETPAPHWQVVDSEGRGYLLQRLVVKDGKLNKTIAVPAYVRDVAKVQIWCSFAQTLLGEAAFEKAVM